MRTSAAWPRLASRQQSKLPELPPHITDDLLYVHNDCRFGQTASPGEEEEEKSCWCISRACAAGTWLVTDGRSKRWNCQFGSMGGENVFSLQRSAPAPHQRNNCLQSEKWVIPELLKQLAEMGCRGRGEQLGMWQWVTAWVHEQEEGEHVVLGRGRRGLAVQGDGFLEGLSVSKCKHMWE